MGEAFGSYCIQPTEEVVFERVNDRPDGPPSVGGTLTVAAFNVLNYFTTLDGSGAICGPNGDQGCRGADSAFEFGRQRAKLVSAITDLDADVLGIVEVENYPGDVPINDLVQGLNDVVGAGTYAALQTGAIGEDAIRVGFIYKPASVTPDGDFAILDSSVDPRFDDDKNRLVLAQTFEQNSNGEEFTAAVNHLKSKGSSCDDVGDPDTGDQQGNCNGTRTAAAEALADWLATDPTDSGDGDFLIIGDLNACRHEDPVQALTGVEYRDLVRHYEGPNAYSYYFFGEAGYLDHALASKSMRKQVMGTAVWHINAAEPSALDYNSYNQAELYQPDEFRSSDHNPVVVGLRLR
jgi:predicted extracellular nuclease